MTDATTETSMLGEAGGLALQLLSASTTQNFNLVNSMYEQEKTRRQALEVLIDDVLRHGAKNFGGTTRDYEEVLDHLRFGLPAGADDEERYAKRHQENLDG